MAFSCRFRRFQRAAVGAAVAIAALSAAPRASADAEGDAKDLFARARDLRNKGDCAGAVPLFAKAHKVFPSGLGSLRNVAECEESLGHYASARRAWLDIKRALITMAQDPKYEGWDKDATDAAARLQPKIATVFVDVMVKSPQGEGPANEKSGVELFVNGESLGTSLVGTPLERDPGNYRVRVQAQHAQPVEQEIALTAGDTKRVTLRLVQTPPEAPAAEIDTGGGKRTAGWILVGVGGAALIGSGVTFLLRQGAKSDLETACPAYESGTCPESSRADATDAIDRGQTMSTLTSVLLPVGLVGMAAGVGLVIWGSNSTERAPAAGAGAAAATKSSFKLTTGMSRIEATWKF